MKKIFLLFFLSSIFYLLSSHCAHAQSGEWTWMKGSAGNASFAVYGTQGIPAIGNTPQGLYEPCEWRDTDGFFWLYGGVNDNFDLYSNLWKYDPSTNEWTWVKGPGNFSNEAAVYGTQGIPAPANTPGARSWCASTWVDNSGDLWLFGGDDQGFASFNDLWKYSIATNEWTWMKGPNTTNQPGIYGTQTVGDPANHPGARRESCATWTDANNNLWLFGGFGNDVTGYTGVLNDVWKYSIAVNDWTWMRGSKYEGDPGSYGTKGLTDTSNNPPSRMVYTKWKDPADNFWIFGGADDSWYNYRNDVWKYAPLENKWTWMSGTSASNDGGTADSFCISGTDLIPSSRLENRACWSDTCGNFWTFGGGLTGNVNDNYNDLWSLNSQTLEWTMLRGSVNYNQAGNYGTQGVSSPFNDPPSRGGSISWSATDGSIWMWGGVDDFDIFYNDLWRYVINPACPELLVCNPQMTPHFSASETILCEKFCIDYFDSSQNNPTSWQWQFPGGNPSSSTDQNPTNICYDLPGTYDVTLITTNANGNDTITLYNYITVYPTPPFPTITQAGYTLTSSPASSYQWQLNATDIPSATNQSYTVLQTGYYTVVVSDSNGCKNSATTYVLISGVDDVSGDANISIYPNPATDGLMVEWLNGFVGDEISISISIMNALGQEIFSCEQQISSGDWKKEIDLHDASSGVYFIEIKSPNIFLKKKIMITN
ncbi:MAG TPA: kelch repeat-containing protein [Chitinophagales bacterium]|nr:kelch repeat-containing protein [Chitinophagales bacterium]